MQVNQDIKAPGCYDWSEFDRKPRGFLAGWCRDHHHANGEPFNYYTVWALVKGTYGGGASGPVIKEIIRTALSEALICEIPLDEAA